MKTEYEVVRSVRRTLGIEVKRDGRILVRAPYGVSKKEIERCVEEKKEWIEKATKRQLRRTDLNTLDEAAVLKLKKTAAEVLPPKVREYADVLGVQPAGITITGARTRFGSCSAKNRLSFSCYLFLYPPECVDYVVVHELCHILHHDHSAAFYAAVAAVMPDYKERERKLKTL